MNKFYFYAGILFLGLFFGELTNANGNPFAPNIDGWVENHTSKRMLVRQFVWADSAKETPSKGWVLSGKIITIEPGQFALIDWIWHWELNVFGGVLDKNVIRGARVEFVGSDEKFDIWFEGNYRGQSFSMVRRVDVCGTLMSDVIGRGCISGHPERAVFANQDQWLAQGSVSRSLDIIVGKEFKVTARGVPYALMAPDIVYTFTNK